MNHVKPLLAAAAFYGVAIALITVYGGDAPSDGWMPVLLGMWTGWGYHKVFRGLPVGRTWSAALRATVLAWAWPIVQDPRASRVR